MNKIEYLKYSIKEKLHCNLDWVFTFFTKVDYNTTKKYIEKNNSLFVKVNDELVELSDVNTKEPIFSIKDSVTIDNEWLSNVSSKIDTTIGRLLANSILIENNFGNVIPYINKSFSIKELEFQIGTNMRLGNITVDQYLKFGNSVNYISSFSKIVSISATSKSVLPPPDISKKKKEIQKKYDERYGPKWRSNRTLINQYLDELKQIDKDWIKDDPSYGKLMSGKIVNNSRVKMYLTFGGESGFDKKSGSTVLVDNSLTEQYPKSKKELAAMFNSSRSGSFDRGHETQKGGAAAKDILRSTSSILVEKGDCGTKKGNKLLVTKNNYKNLYGRYLISGEKIDNGEKYIGQIIEIRSPMFCLNKGSNFCSICSGDILAGNPDGISLRLLEVSNTLLTLALKSMHTSVTNNINYTVTDNLK